MNPKLLHPATGQGQAEDSTLSNHQEEAKRRLEDDGGPLLLADWTGAAFLHYEADPDRLQEFVPWPLDLREGRALLSLVAFTMRRVRFARGGRAMAWTTAPIATQPLLNLRTYVRGVHGPGIFFMREWIDHPFAAALGPPTFGLPYRRGRHSWRSHREEVSGTIRAGGAEGGFSGRLAGAERIALAESLDEFLLERYTAYTAGGFRPLSFRVWHEPWRFRTLELDSSTMDAFLRHLRQPWTEGLRFAGAVFSEGVREVWMGWPRTA